MVTKKIGLLIATLIIGASNLSFAAENNQRRYQVIADSFLPETNKFETGFTTTARDITIVQEHKKALEQEVMGYKASWAPIALKIAGIGFGIGAGRNAVAAFLNVLPSSGDFYNTIENLWDYMGYTSLNVNTGIIGKAGSKLRNLTEPGTAQNLGFMTLRIGDSLITASIATWLFKKANSYRDEIAKLEAEIAVDDQIIAALNKPQTK